MNNLPADALLAVVYMSCPAPVQTDFQQTWPGSHHVRPFIQHGLMTEDRNEHRDESCSHNFLNNKGLPFMCHTFLCSDWL